MDDSVRVTVKNTSKTEAMIFSIYKQRFIDNEWITNVYDVFADVKNPNSTLLIVEPLQQLELKVYIDDQFFTNADLPPAIKNITNKTKRIVLRGFKERDQLFKIESYSNPFQ